MQRIDDFKKVTNWLRDGQSQVGNFNGKKQNSAFSFAVQFFVRDAA